jgi:uncharacterized membrane protein
MANSDGMGVARIAGFDSIGELALVRTKANGGSIRDWVRKTLRSALTTDELHAIDVVNRARPTHEEAADKMFEEAVKEGAPVEASVPTA